MPGPSEKAVEHAKVGVMGRVLTGWSELEEAARLLHDPALGEDASVRLGDVLDALVEYRRVTFGVAEPHSPWAGAARWLEREHREGRL